MAKLDAKTALAGLSLTLGALPALPGCESYQREELRLVHPDGLMLEAQGDSPAGWYEQITKEELKAIPPEERHKVRYLREENGKPQGPPNLLQEP